MSRGQKDSEEGGRSGECFGYKKQDIRKSSAIGNSKRSELKLGERWEAWRHSDGVM